MTGALGRTLDRIRQPEYTGPNRCLPCTAVNLLIAILGSLVVAAGVRVVGGFVGAVTAGAGTLAVSLALIALRGYLIPGTPWFTRTYFPDRVLRWFDKAPPVADARETADPEVVLREAGALTECADRDDLCLADGFGAAWRDRIDTLRNRDIAREELASVLDVPADRLSIHEHADAFVASLDGDRVGQWESEAAFLADVAAAAELRTRYGPWSGLDVHSRSDALGGLRLFLEQCPSCGGRVSMGQEVVSSCCRSVDVVAVSCEDCDARLFETEYPD